MVFPENFYWGVSLSGFQFEMGGSKNYSVDSNSDWYSWVHNSENIRKGFVSGDLPENGVGYWDLYKKDHEIAKNLGLNAFRLGIEWSRIFPEDTTNINGISIERSFDGKIAEIEIEESSIEKLEHAANKNAVSHYRNIINDLISKGFRVFICLNHFTLPLWLHDPIKVYYRFEKKRTGWLNERTIIEYTKYASYMAWKFGDIIDEWITINEPMIISEMGYLAYFKDQQRFPPGIKNFNLSIKTVLNMIIAHSRAYDAIKRWDSIKVDEQSDSSANIGLIQHVMPVTPLNQRRKSDAIISEYIDRVHNHLFIKAIHEGWLDENLNGVKEKGENKNYLRKRLDFIGLNYYTRIVVKGKLPFLTKLFLNIPALPELVHGYGLNCQPMSKSLDGFPTSDYGWEIYPNGINEVLTAMSKYRLPLYIMENGIADANDNVRPRFLIQHLKVVEKTLDKNNIDLRGYFHWSLLDNYEWAEGYKQKFGLFAVNMRTKKRIARRSAFIYKKIIDKASVTKDIIKEVESIP
jgi:beta-galactosidase